MAAAPPEVLTAFALDVLEGLSQREQKKLSPAWLYNDLGSCLFDSITFLPEYGLTRADERLLRRLSPELPAFITRVESVAELGSGSGKKTRLVLEALAELQDEVVYRPIDVSNVALENCRQSLSDVAVVEPVCGTWVDGLSDIAFRRASQGNSDLGMLLMFLGSSIGNIERDEIVGFLAAIRQNLRVGDWFLIGADLIKSPETLLAAYDDEIGVTAAFNRNLLARINRELGADFDLREFDHEARWNEQFRRIEMHLVSRRKQVVNVRSLQTRFEFDLGESIWTESSHKFELDELHLAAQESGFTPVQSWLDPEWPFAEMLWRATEC